jgi:hypothetical protein
MIATDYIQSSLRLTRWPMAASSDAGGILATDVWVAEAGRVISSTSALYTRCWPSDVDAPASVALGLGCRLQVGSGAEGVRRGRC